MRLLSPLLDQSRGAHQNVARRGRQILVDGNALQLPEEAILHGWNASSHVAAAEHADLEHAVQRNVRATEKTATCTPKQRLLRRQVDVEISLRPTRDANARY
jgi:hypothetical protein